MVKFFESTDGYNSGRWNWVSDTNRFVGFDNTRGCCEDFGYYYTKKIGGKKLKYLDRQIHRKLVSGNNNFELGDVIVKEKDDHGVDNYAFVELIDADSKQFICFLVIYNSHNGYYAHGLYYKTTARKLRKQIL